MGVKTGLTQLIVLKAGCGVDHLTEAQVQCGKLMPLLHSSDKESGNPRTKFLEIGYLGISVTTKGQEKGWVGDEVQQTSSHFLFQRLLPPERASSWVPVSTFIYVQVARISLQPGSSKVI